MDANTEPQVPERKARKSVAFTNEQVVVDADGTVRMVNSVEDPQATALSHTPRTPPLTAALESFTDASSKDPVAATEDVPDDVGLDLTLKKKKKKKTKTEEEEGDAADAAAPADDGGLDLTLKKKKKKKVPVTDDEFAAKLKALEIEGKEDAAATPEAPEIEEGDMEVGTGIWAHDDARPTPYKLLLKRFYVELSHKNPDHALSGTKSYKIPPPQCMREGNKKTIFANIAEICKRMKRSDEHVTAYLFAELGTSGSVDGSRRLVIKGRFQQKQIENILRKYIMEYVSCRTCKSPDTELNKGENRLYFITCNSCGSRRSVTAIKTGFSAQVGKRRKMQG